MKKANLLMMILLISTGKYTFSQGNDFQYLIKTGDSIDAGGVVYRQIHRKRNIAKVIIKEFELDYGFKISEFLQLKTSYTFSQAEITDFQSEGQNDSENHKDNFLAETPFYQFFTGIILKNRIVIKK